MTANHKPIFLPLIIIVLFSFVHLSFEKNAGTARRAGPIERDYGQGWARRAARKLRRGQGLDVGAVTWRWVDHTGLAGGVSVVKGDTSGGGLISLTINRFLSEEFLIGF